MRLDDNILNPITEPKAWQLLDFSVRSCNKYLFLGLSQFGFGINSIATKGANQNGFMYK